MKRVVCAFFVLVLAEFLTPETAFSQARGDDLLYSMLFGWKTEGSHELLGKTATAVRELKTDKGFVLSFGSLLGPTGIVKNDNGVQFLRAARSSGIDCVIPAAGEFGSGVDTFQILSVYPNVPTFLSANIVNEKTRRHLVKPFVIRSVSGLRVCIVGMSDMNIIKDSPDENVAGIDILPYPEAFDSVINDISEEYPDIVVVAGRLDRKSVMSLAGRYPVIDVFVTNNVTGGFSDDKVATKTVLVADKPVYIVSDAADRMSRLTVRYAEGIETRELVELKLDDSYPPAEDIMADLQSTIDELDRRDREDKNIVRTGSEVASVLREVFEVDVVAIERETLFYYPIEDSLTLLDVRKVVRPSRRLVSINLKGSLLRSIWEQSTVIPEAEFRLHFAGISEDGKVDDIPIQDDRDYTVLTTPFLRSGGGDYYQFTQGTGERYIDRDILRIVESRLVSKDEMLRLAAKKKIWDLSLNLSVGSNFNKTDIDRDQALYGEVPPKEFRNLKDLFSGFFEVSSWDDKFTLRTQKHIYESRLRARYLRSGFRTDEGDISYREGRDELQLYNKYTYDLPGFKLKPFSAIDIYSELYSPGGKHPITASARAGLSREIKSLWGMVLEIGIDGTRNYVINENTFGTTNKFTLNKEFPARGLFTTPTKLSIDAQVTWNPMAQYNMAFFMRNNNRIDFQIWKKFNATFHIKTYSYRDTRHRKVAVGFIYDFTLNYKMDWNF